MTEPTKAVFLSYASQDAEAAARICNALRAVGIEVWFDQSELRGGDAWDQMIRRQIRECALFLAVISAHTNERDEGYFRREWNLAVERTVDMASDKPFLLPVVVDGTPDATARVPDKFCHIQWTRLPEGNTPPAFVERVTRLLSPQPVPQGRTPSPAVAAMGPTRGASRWSGTVPWLIGAAALIAVGYVLVDRLKLSKHEALTGQQSAVQLTTPSAIPEKSIAVLPFVDMSEKHDQEYFSDGLSEELIDHLAHNANLKVIARTSSFQFKGKNEDMRSIATKLGVANLLEGSVRKAGVELRITAQLIRASDGVHLWSQTYERELKDIFKVQDEIAGTVAKALDLMLNMGSNSAERGKPNPEAYNLALQGKYFYFRGNSGDTQRAIRLYKKSLAADPTFALAWAWLGHAYAYQFEQGDGSPSVARANALDAARRALEIDPRLASVHRLLGNIARDEWNWDLAQSEYEKASALDKEDLIAKTDLAALNGILTGRIGDNYVQLLKREHDLDPLDTNTIAELAGVLAVEGRLSESLSMWQKVLDLNPNYAEAKANIGGVLWLMRRYSEALAITREETVEEAALPALSCIYWAMGRRTESDAALTQFQTNFAKTRPYSLAGTYACRHERDAVFEWLDRAYDARVSGLTWVKLEPWFRDFHDDPKFKALLRKMNLPET